MKNWLLRGFSLMELLIVIVIVGILATVAVPSYLDYVARAEASAALQALNGLQRKVIEDLTIKGDCVVVPATPYGGAPQLAQYSIKKLAFANCSLVAQFKTAADVNQRVADQFYALSVEIIDNNYVWTCTSSLPDNVRPGQCTLDTSISM